MNLKSSFRIVALLLLAGAFAYIVKQQDSSTETIPTTDLRKSIAAKQFDAALKTANQALRSNPQDPDALLAKGIALAGLNQHGEAVSLYQKMTRDFPDMAEPYNNLAALLAAEGKHEQARQALEKALQTQGSYAVAYKNLNAVYAKLADEAYNKALDVSQDKNSPPLQLNLLSGRVEAGSLPSVIAMSSIEQPKAASKPAVVAAAKPVEKPVEKPAETPAEKPATPATPSEPVKVAVVSRTSTQEAAKPADKPAEKPAEKPQTVAKADTKPANNVSDSKSERDVSSTVQAWAAAWSKQDVKQYLSYYASNFDPGNQSRSAWESDRRARIGGKSHIAVAVSDLAVSFKSPTLASVKFRQSYKSDRLNSQTSKTLVLERKGDAWRIVTEKAGG